MKRVKKGFHGFIEFVREQGIVGLAIGFILGGAVSTVVSSLVKDVIQPAIALVFGNTEGLVSLQYYSIKYGQFLANLIDFLIIAFVVFAIFKGLQFEKLDKKKS